MIPKLTWWHQETTKELGYLQTLLLQKPNLGCHCKLPKLLQYQKVVRLEIKLNFCSKSVKKKRKIKNPYNIIFLFNLFNMGVYLFKTKIYRKIDSDLQALTFTRRSVPVRTLRMDVPGSTRIYYTYLLTYIIIFKIL